MSIRETLEGAVKNTVGSIKIIKVTGSDTGTRIQGADNDRSVMFDARLPVVIPEFSGAFGIGNIDLLKAFVGLAAYKADKASISVKRRQNQDAVETIEFRDANKTGVDFRCMSPDLVPPQVEIKHFPWDITFKPSAAKITEFQQIAAVFAGGDIKDQCFGVKVDNEKLVATFGTESAATHRGSMVLEEGITTKFSPMSFSHAHFGAVVKLAGSNPITIRLANKPAILGVEIATPIGPFLYYLRPHVVLK